MSTTANNIGPEFVTHGLLMHFDAGNPSSFAGAPTTNLYSVTDFGDWSAYTAKNYDSYGRGIDGETAYRIYDTSSVAYHGVSLNPTTITGGERYTLSIWFLKNTLAQNRTHFRIAPNAGGGYLSLRLYNDMGTVDIARNDTILTSSVAGVWEEKIRDGQVWRRGYVTFTTNPAMTSLNTEMLVAHDNLSNVANATTTGSTIVCCPQLELNLQPTKFIKGSRSSTNCFLDLTPNNFSGSFYNSISESIDKKGTLQFNGTTQYVQVSNTSAVPSYSGSISAWATTNSLVTSQMVLFTTGASTNRYYIIFSSGNIYVYRGTNVADYVLVATSIVAGEWYNITMTYDSSSLYGYVDGRYIGRKGYTGSATFGSSLYLGSQTGASQPLDGKIATFSMYNRKLSSEEVLQNYNALKARFK